jgi:hypothetical protein
MPQKIPPNKAMNLTFATPPRTRGGVLVDRTPRARPNVQSRRKSQLPRDFRRRSRSGRALTSESAFEHPERNPTRSARAAPRNPLGLSRSQIDGCRGLIRGVALGAFAQGAAVPPARIIRKTRSRILGPSATRRTTRGPAPPRGSLRGSPEPERSWRESRRPPRRPTCPWRPDRRGR